MFEQSPLLGPGTGSVATHTLEIVILLVVAFILGYLLRYFLDRDRGQQAGQEVLELERLRHDNQRLQDELHNERATRQQARIAQTQVKKSRKKADDQKQQLINEMNDLRRERDALHNAIVEKSKQLKEAGATIEQDHAYEALLERKAATGYARFKTDDLKIIKGIGPKIERLLRKSGIDTWELLAKASEKHLQGILDSGGDRFRIHDPETWAKQASLAMKGKWEELRELQDEIIDGHHYKQ